MLIWTSVWLPAGGRFSGHVPKDDPPTSSDSEMSRTDWPPVCEPEMPVNRRSMSDAPCPAGRGNLLR